MKNPPIKWGKLIKEFSQYSLAVTSFTCAIASRVLPGKAGIAAEAGGIFLGLVFLQISPRFTVIWKQLNSEHDKLQQRLNNLEKLFFKKFGELENIESEIAAHEELSRQRIDAILAAERQVLSEREAELVAREQAVEEDEQESAIALEQLQEQKASEVQAYFDQEKSNFERYCEQQEAEFKEFKLEFLRSHQEKVDQLEGRIEQQQSELAHCYSIIEQLQETFPDDLEQSTIVARAIRDVLRSQGISSIYRGAYSHEDGRIFVRLRIEYPEAKVRPYLGLIQQRLGVSSKIDLAIAKGAMQFVITPDSLVPITPRVIEGNYDSPSPIRALIEGEFTSARSNYDSSTNVEEGNSESKKPIEVLNEPLESLQDFLRIMEPPLIQIKPVGDISTTERNWILKLWLIDKIQNQRHVLNIVYGARPGDSAKWVRSRARLHKVLDAYNISYQVRGSKYERVSVD